MTTELTYLALVSLLTAFAWIPNILDSFIVRGIMDTIGYPKSPKPLHSWAERAMKAHANASANLPVFAAAILIVVISQTTNEITAMAAMIYFYARLVHLIVYILGVPGLRTLAFLVGFGCQVAILLQAL